MKKWKAYYLIARNTWDQTIVYRLNFILWRVRVVLQLLTTYFLWASIIPQQGKFLGYSHSLILTYILGTSFIYSFVLTSKSQGLGDDINQGNLSNFLVRPINYFLYWFSADIGDKCANIAFSLVELALFIFIFHPPLFLQQNILYVCLACVSILLAIGMYFFINFLFGCIAFWSSEVWAPRFILNIVLSFFAGSLFPLDILPRPIFLIFNALPFPYLLYFPLKVYLGQLPIHAVMAGLCISCTWVVLLYFGVLYVWRKGLVMYAAYGK